MPRYLLDTNIASFLVRKASAALDYRVNLVPKGDLLISAVTEAEMRFGLALLPEGAKQHQVVGEFLREIAIAPWDSSCAKEYALLAATQRRSGKPLSTSDTMIAAHALSHDFTLISNDAAFTMVDGLKLQDWTEGPQKA